MKCINKFLSLFIIVNIICFSFTACGSNNEEFASFSIYDSSSVYGMTNNRSDSNLSFYAENFCVAGTDDIGITNVTSKVAEAGGAFNLATNDVVYSQHMHEKIYPASTTKILTCYVACLYGDLDSYITVSANATKQDRDSSVCNLKQGDIISLRDLLYGLMLRSGNDAAIAIAEGISEDTDSFVELMNATAYELGATNSHFMNPNGLHNEEHYTTVYDMYLILNAALANPTFNTIFSAKSYNANYTSNGASKTVEWNSTNQYFSGKISTPSGLTILGGKTGTTGAAGYCLALVSENERNEKIISFVYNADCRSNLYLLMNEILTEYCT